MTNPFQPQGQQAQPAQGQQSPFGGPPLQQAQPQAANLFGGNQAGQQSQQQGAPLRSLDDALAGGVKSAFREGAPVGLIVRGRITSSEIVQRRDYVTKAPQFWDDGKPQEQVVVKVENAEYSTDNGANYQPLREGPDDDGRRGFYIKTWGSQVQQLQQAIQNAGAASASEALAPGGMFSGAFTGTKPSGGGDPEKLYAYHIDRNGAAPPAAQPAQQQAAQTPQQVANLQEKPPW